MKVIKGIVIFLIVTGLAVFACLMFMPIDTFIAEKSAKAEGYDVPTGYDDGLYRYYYNKLNDKEQIAYRIVYAAFAATEDEFPTQIVIPKLSNNELEEMYTAISYDNPQFYFLGNKCSMTSIGSVNYLVPQYIMTLKDYKASWAVVSLKADSIIASIPAVANTDYEKELYIHDYLVQNSEYDDSNNALVYTMHGVLVDGRANCEGYSRTMQYLLRAANIYNYLAVGDAEGESGVFTGHMWNIVSIDNEFYNLDVTWDDYAVAGSVDYPDNSVSHVFFNMSTDDIKKSHNIDDNSAWKNCKSDSYGYYKKSGLYFKSYSGSAERAMKDALTESLNSGYNSVEFAFASKSTFDDAFNRLVTRGGMYGIIVDANSRVSGDKKIDAGSVQYTLDEKNLIMRFFFMK